MKYYALFSYKHGEKCIGFIKCNDIVEDFYVLGAFSVLHCDLSQKKDIEYMEKKAEFWSESAEVFYEKHKGE